MILDYIKLKEVKPALAGYIREAQLMLEQSPAPNDKAVHDVRVLMKKSRAVLLLIRSQIDEESYKREYQALREVGRLMSSWRETSVHRKTLKNLRKNHASVFSDLKDFEPLNHLVERAAPGEEDIEKVTGQSEQIVELLGKSGYRIRFLSLNKLDPVILMKDLEQTYSSVIHSYLNSRNNITPDNLHEFRKKSKSFLYQLWFFRPLKPGAVKGLEKKIDIK